MVHSETLYTRVQTAHLYPKGNANKEGEEEIGEGWSQQAGRDQQQAIKTKREQRSKGEKTDRLEGKQAQRLESDSRNGTIHNLEEDKRKRGPIHIPEGMVDR